MSKLPLKPLAETIWHWCFDCEGLLRELTTKIIWSLTKLGVTGIENEFDIFGNNSMAYKLK